MTTFDIKNLNEGAWFDYEVDGGGDTVSQVKIRAISQDLILETREKCSTVRIEFKSAIKHGPLQPVEIRETDDKKMKSILWDYLIVDWQGFKNPDGTDLECTTENKAALMGGAPEFYEFVDSKVDLLSTAIESKKETSAKN